MLRLIFSLLRSSFGIAKKGLFIVCIYAIAITALTYFINKDRQELIVNKPVSSAKTVYSYINDPKFNSTDDGKIKIMVMKALTCSFTGQACTDNPKDDKKNAENSIATGIGRIFSSAYTNPPASGIGWTLSGLANAGFVPQTYAWQGTGYAGLMPFNPLWKLFRNISFSLLVLIVITLGFLIMFRAKLDPQAVVSIENSLPRIVVSMLVITFSFAIAGFFIDMMYVIIGLGISVLKPVDGTHISPTSLHNAYVYADLGNIWESIFPDNVYKLGASPRNTVGAIFSPFIDVAKLGNAIMGIFPPFFGRLLNVIVALIAGINVVGVFTGKLGIIPILGNLFNNVGFLGISAGNIPSLWGIILSVLVFFVAFVGGIVLGAGFFLGMLILLTMVFLIFRIFFMLLFGYLRLLILIIFAPIILLFEAIPGQSTFSNWMKGMISELIMFPAVIFLLIVGEIIISLPTTSYAGGVTYWENQNLVWQPPFINGLSGDNFAVLIGMGLLFLIPDLVKVLKETIGAKPFPVQMGLGTYLGGIGAVGGAGMGTLHQAGAVAHLFPGIRNILNNVPILNRFTKEAHTGSPPATTGRSDEGEEPLKWTGG